MSNDPYARSGRRFGSGAGDLAGLMRSAMGILGAGLILTGAGLAITLFGFIRGIIVEPEDFARSLDIWTEPRPEAVEVEEEVEASEPGKAPEPKSSSEGEAEKTVDADGSAAAAQAPTPEEAQRLAAARRSIAQDNPTEVENGFREFVRLVREGGMGRATGAFIMFLMTWLLLKIPFGFIGSGIKLLSLSTGEKR